MKCSRYAVALIATSLLIGCTAEVEDEDIAAVSSPIVNGTAVTANRYSAAVYHYATNKPTPSGTYTGWWPRPCSGTIVRRVNTSQPNWTYILTARHCVTQDGTPGGTLVNREQLRVSTAISPGISPPNAPPANTSSAAVFASSADSDIALLTVSSYLAFGPYAFGIKWTAPVANTTLAVWGYGQYTDAYDSDDPYYDQAGLTGAGTLRSGVFKLGSVEAGYYEYVNPNASGQKVWHGDSGSCEDQLDNDYDGALDAADPDCP